MAWCQKGVCVGCGAILTVGRGYKFCSRECRKKYHAKRYEKINGARLQVATATVGAINEYLVGIDLLKRGLPVYRALSPSAPGDLAVLIGKKLAIVEVTTGARSTGGVLTYPPHRAHYYDVLAVVERSGVITYIPDSLYAELQVPALKAAGGDHHGKC